MNKIFKVVWSKTKECYVVVSEVAKNNSGKKKVLASVLAALAVVGAGAAGTPVQAAQDLYNKVNISPTGTLAGGSYPNTNSVSEDSVVVGYGNTTAGAAGYGHVAYGFGNTATEDTTTAIGGGNKATGPAATAVGSFNEATGRNTVAVGNVAKANNTDNIAIGTYSEALTNGQDAYALAMGSYSKANAHMAVGIGALANATGTESTAVGAGSKASAKNSQAFGARNTASGQNATAIGYGNTSKVEDTITMGTSNNANTGGGIAIGQNNLADATANGGRNAGSTQIAIGRDNRAAREDTIAIGREVKAENDLSVAIGNRTEATANAAIAIGTNGAPDASGTVFKTKASGFASIAVGMQSEATASVATAVGGKASATGASATALGHGATANEKASVAVGKNATVNKQKTTSNYEFSGSNGTPSPAGYDTETITVNSGSAPAGGAVAGNYYDAGSGIAIGNGATVSDESDRAVVVGPDAKTNGNAHYSVVLGSGSHADASDGFVGGHGSSVASRESIAIGAGANVSGTENIRSQAIGFGATVTGTGAYDATAIGATAQVSGVQGGVALGSGSLLSRTTNSNENIGWNSKYVDGTVVRNRAYKAKVNALDQWDAGAQIGAVSVGNDTQKRQIINVAAGSQDTDAVNVAQLKNVGVRVGADTNTATIGTNKVAADFLAYNGQLNIKGDNNRVTTVSENDSNGKDANVNVKFDYDGLVKAKDGSSVTVNQKTEGGKTVFEIDAAAGSKTVVADGKNTTVTGAGTTASPYKVNVEGALTGISSITNNGGGKIEFATGGTTISGGPVNVSNNKITGVANGDVNSTSTDAVNGSQLHAVKTAERHIAPTTAGHEYTVDSNGNVTMTYLDGNNNAVTGEQAVIKGIAKQDLSNINDAGKKVITGLGTIVKAGDNVNVSESSDATTGQKTYTVNAVTPAVYTKADGTKVYKRPDGTFTTNSNLAAGNNVDKGDVITSFMDGNGNTTGGNMVINNVGSAIDKTGTSTGNTFLTKLDTAATNTPNAAVNVKDLKNTSDALINKGLNFTGNNDATVNAHKLGSLVKVQGEGVAATDVPSFASAAGNIAVVANGTDTLELKLNKNLKGINSISNGSSSITLNSNPGGTNNTPAVQITGGNLSMGNGTINNKIVNLAPGTNDTDAVNYSQIKGLRTEVKQGANVTVSKTQGTDGHDIYTISAAATGGTASSWNIKSSADTANGGATATGHNANAVNISDQKTVEMVAGKNLTVKQDTTTDGAKVELALSDNIVAGKDGVNGKDGSVGATGKDGSSVVINGADGSIGMTGPKGQDGKDGINGRDGANISMTSAKGEQVLVNRDPAHSADTDKAERIVYVPKDASGNPIQGADGKNIVREVATMDDGLKFAGDDAQGTDKSKVIAKKLNNTVDIIGGADKDKLTDNNIGVNNDGNGKLKVQLSKEITGLTSVQIGGNTIKTDGDHITITSPDTTPGATPGATVTHKVANLSDEMHIRDTVYTVSADKKVTLTYVDGNGNPVNNKTAVIDLSGLPVGDKDTDMRIKEGTYTAQNGTVTLETVNKDGSTANKDVVIKGINTNQYKAGDNVTFIQDGTDTNGNPIYKINADLSGASSTEKVIRKNDTNNLAKVDTQSTHAAGEKGETYIVSVDKNDVKDAAREAVEVTGSGVIKVTADNTTTPHKTTYDVAYDPDKAAEVTKISYKSSTSPDAGSQGPKKVSLKDGFDFKSTGGNVKITTDNAGGIDFNVDLSGIHGVSQNIAVGGNVDPTSLTGTDTVTKGTRFDAGNNLVVKRTALNDTGLDHAISYELNKDLQGINSIRNANNGPVMNFNAGDIAISGGNLSMGDGTHNNKIVNVAPGTDKSDVATVGQLTKVVSSNGTVTIAPVYKDQDGAPVYDLSVTGVPGADPRVDQLAEEIGRVGAQGAALSALKPIQYDPLEPTQIMAGYGNYRGNSALALGVAHYKNESTLIHGGVSWAGGSSHMMANAGVTWKVGNRDSEAAVADRYRKGPISSAYAMQQEMASVKAQNAGLKSEVSDLKAENEQMKAQIAAMMAKLGM